MQQTTLNFDLAGRAHLVHAERPATRVKNQNGLLSPAKWLIALAADYAIIAIAFLIVCYGNWIAYPVSLLLLGIAQHRIAILGHDGAHGLICRNKKLNYWLTQLFCFWPLLSDIKSYQRFHFEHHRHTGNKQLDPELNLKQSRYHLPLTKNQFYGRFFLDLFGASIGEFIEVSLYISRRSNPFWAASFPLLSCAFSFWIGHPEFFVLFMISKPTTFWAVFRLRVYTEHVDTEGTHRFHVALWQRLLFAPHNTWMHWEHHKHPQVAFWQLPALREKYKDVPIVNFDALLLKHKSHRNLNHLQVRIQES